MRSIPSKLTRKLVEAYQCRLQLSQGILTNKDMIPGESLIQQGDFPENVYIVLSGSLKIHHNTPKGAEFLVAIAGPGEIIGEVEALTREACVCSATSLKKSTVGVIPKEAYAQWLEEDHGFALLVNLAMSYRLQKVVRRSATHLCYPLEYSVLKLFAIQVQEEGSTRLPATKEELANYLGTNTRSINRVLKDLEQKNVLRSSKELEITSLEQLEWAIRTYDK